MRKSSKSHHSDDHDEGHSEGWLVSYADMMTLLFGLFVMLYSIAMENQGHIDKQLSEVSTSLSKTETSPPPKPPEPPKVENLVETIKEKDEQLAEMKKNLDLITAQQKDSDLLASAVKLKNTELTEQIDALKKVNEELKPIKKPEVKPDNELVESEKKNKILKDELEQIKKSKKETEAQIEQIKIEKKQLEKKIAETKPTPKRETASVDDKAEKLKELDQEVQQQRTIAADLQKQIQQKDQQMSQLNKDLKALQDEEKKAPKFLMFVLKWFTEKHDLDLIVYDSNGKKFDFKKREYPNYPGRLALDSRSGPGAEIWQTNEFIPGEYRMIVQFYQQYNNPEDAKFVIEVSSPKTSFATSANTIKFSEKTKEFRFKVSEKGAVTLL